MLTVALTGNIAAGKSTVAELFRRWGATVIDADRLVREAQAPGSPVLAAIAERFGPDLSTRRDARPGGAPPPRDGRPGRAGGAQRMVHPDVLRRRAALERRRGTGRPDRGERHPAALRGGRPVRVRRRRAGGCARDVRRARLLAQRGLSPEDADRMLAAQAPTGPKRERSDYVIDNNGDRAALEARARERLDAAALPPRALDLARRPAYPPTRHPRPRASVSNVPDDLVYTPEHEYVAPHRRSRGRPRRHHRLRPGRAGRRRLRQPAQAAASGSRRTKPSERSRRSRRCRSCTARWPARSSRSTARSTAIRRW